MKRLTWAGVLLGLVAGCDGGTELRDNDTALPATRAPLARAPRTAVAPAPAALAAQSTAPAQTAGLGRLPDGDPTRSSLTTSTPARMPEPGMASLPALPSGAPPSSASTALKPRPVATAAAHETTSEDSGPTLGQLPPIEPVPTKPAKPTGLAVRLVNGKRLRIDYVVHSSSADAAGVELWYTRDGKNWTRDPSPPQRRSPYLMEIKQEGLYGLTLVACTENASDKPEPGDAPQCWVAVDWTRPTVSLAGVEINGSHRQLSVRWSAADANLGPRPITLSYAEKPSGPWTTLAANIRNDGHYEGPLPRTLPSQFYVRVEAADQVGNIGEAHSKTPVVLDASLLPQERRPQIQKVDCNDD